jgi:2,3-bisphosphoglycerate-independent phosphoglycerate mutase
VVLVILDGWGIGPDYPGNAILAANTPVMDDLADRYPRTTLLTSGLAVGLPAGQMGNSEVGHLNIGAGFVVYQWITRIDQAIEDGSFAQNTAIKAAMEGCLERGKALHLIGLVGEGGVHSHSRHLIALLDAARSLDLARTYIHAITDGRDTSPVSGAGFVRDVQDACQRRRIGRIATVSGRYYAMDRDKRWERIQMAYDAMTSAVGPSYSSALAAIEASYASGVTDEFIAPCVISPPGADPITIQPGDSVIFFNFRADRARQLVQALTLPDFDSFNRDVDLSGRLALTTMTRYQEGLPVEIAFEPHDVEYPVARVVSEAGHRQFHAAETEKYAHVTFFINGGREAPFEGEQRTLIPSPRVATYDLQPEMSAQAVTDAVVNAILSHQYAWLVVNFANGDMVGHTGVFSAAVKAIETVDSCLGRILAAVNETGAAALITADHGNSDEMIDRETGAVLTAHTTNPVPLILVLPDAHPLRHATLRTDGKLANIAPTILDLMGLPRPAAMTEPSLIAGLS